MFDYPIAIGLSPNTERDDILQAIKILFRPWDWKEGKIIEKIEKWFRDYYQVDDAVSFNSVRSALMAILKAFNIREGDEVIIQAFTCVAVPGPIIWMGAKPVYVDIDETFNIDPVTLEKHITPKTRAIIVQHTFGTPAKIELIKKIAQKYNLVLIEDCAHSLGATVEGKKIGSFGDAAFFSFGRDKIISSVFGGMAILSQKSKIKNQKLRISQQKLLFPSYSWILQQLLHPIAFLVILPLYSLSIGKLILAILLKLKILSKPVYREEMCGDRPSIFPAKYPNALAMLLVNQLTKLPKYNQKRIENAKYYFAQLGRNKDINLPPDESGAVYLRLNILTRNSQELLSRAKTKGIILGNWYREIVDPVGVLYKKIGYEKGSCPQAEKIASLSINLPTYPRMAKKDLDKIMDLFRI